MYLEYTTYLKIGYFSLDSLNSIRKFQVIGSALYVLSESFFGASADVVVHYLDAASNRRIIVPV